MQRESVSSVCNDVITNFGCVGVSVGRPRRQVGNTKDPEKTALLIPILCHLLSVVHTQIIISSWMIKYCVCVCPHWIEEN